MKPLEEIFFRACVNEQKRKSHSNDRELSIRTIGNIFERLGFSYKQLMYYVSKWSDRGFYDYGVTLDLGWFEFDKLTGEYKQIYDSMTSMDRWKDGELASYIVSNSFNRERITNFVLREHLGIGKDEDFFNPYRKGISMKQGKRIFIPDIECDK